MDSAQVTADSQKSADAADPAELTARAQIRDAAMRLFASEGVEATSMKMIAEAADKSVGLVQHYFGTKARLVEVINEHAIQVVRRFLDEVPARNPAGGDSLEYLGDQFIQLGVQHTDVLDYCCRALIHGDELGAEVFDAFYDISASHHRMFDERDMLVPNLDVVPSVILPVLMRISVFILREQIERKLGTSLLTPAGIRRMDAATTQVIRHGMIKPDFSPSEALRPPPAS
ncbi:TetR/AcrR family transcriptional regulator [Mycolicibacterium mucogenicum]|uniref:TetR/AcrR family transcriptional regulator n=1 Tax=Mycolicibacterium mucogenicum TaxID=56689 RepID=UPI00226A5721|nr:TetR/AcrR family transcriptional regulator [Mycolicibacterium mucogenicum]MCX8558988.1 TetR/AcrR family transcriptional regulator [Mycolicibacterium mucogenicum]